MPPLQDPPDAPYVVMAAWFCQACDVAGRSLTPEVDTVVACWNCDGQVTVTARPVMRLGEP